MDSHSKANPKAPSDDVVRRKRQLRRLMRAQRQDLSALDWQARSEAVVRRLLNLDALLTSRAVATYWPMVERREVDLRPLARELQARGVTLSYPVMLDGEEGFRIAREQDLATPPLSEPLAGSVERVDDALPPRGKPPQDLEQPALSLPAPATLDAILVPALAASPSGQRLGYGAGFYDRVLRRYPTAHSVAVVFDFALLEDLPAEEHDARCGWVVTDCRTLCTTS